MNNNLAKLLTLSPGNKFRYGTHKYLIVTPTRDMLYLTGRSATWCADLISGELCYINSNEVVVVEEVNDRW